MIITTEDPHGLKIGDEVAGRGLTFIVKGVLDLFRFVI